MGVILEVRRAAALAVLACTSTLGSAARTTVERPPRPVDAAPEAVVGAASVGEVAARGAAAGEDHAASAAVAALATAVAGAPAASDPRPLCPNLLP